MIKLVLVAVCMAATVSAGPAVATARELHRCAGHCKDGGKLSYEVGKSYIYDYRAPMSTSITGVGTEESRLSLTATVEIHVTSPCDLTMKLSNVSLEDALPTPLARSVEFSTALERSALMFSFQDGVIDELCVSSDDPAWVVNVKRGVLSMFQNSMKQLETDHKVYESDVIGECETEYKIVLGSGTSTVLFEKSKSPLACSRPTDNFLSLQSTQYNSPSHAQSLPLVTSEHTCYISYEDGTLLMAVCNESHLFRPFSNDESGAVTRLEQNLLRTGIVTGTPGQVVGATTRTTLLYQHDVAESESLSRANVIVSTLEELDRKTVDGIESDVPRLFSTLVATLRTTGYPTLAKVFSHTREGHTRKFLLDAMPLVGTADGLTVMTDLFKSGEITAQEMDSWLTSLTFIKRPTLTMLMAVSSLLDNEPRPKAILGISALIHSFCQRDSDCRDKEPVSEALGKMERLLGAGCHVKGRHDMELKILALKGIANAGVLPASLDNIARCYQQADNPMEVRLAAVAAHRRMPCIDSWRHRLLDTYIDMQQDTELRITAYLTVMQCPSARTLHRIKEALSKEEVNQVASFVWTHLTNLQETSSRWKQNIRDLLTNDFLRNKFQTDARKFSRNYEASTFVGSLDAGATVESNVVFTPQSYLPRSATLNLTVDIFGESVNVFEVGARAEGFEQIIEDMFGPGGYFPDKSLRQMLQKARGNVDDALENSVDELASVFNAKRKLAKEPQASLYARVFGNEIHYSRYQGMEELTGGHPHIRNPIDLFAKLFGGKDLDITNSFVFVDASYKIPTSVGLPLELSVNGSATVGLKMNGHVDLRDLWRKNSLEIQGQIMPSAAVEVTGTMSLDAFIAQASLQTISTLHTNTYLDGKVTIQDGSIVDVKINVPREKVEIVAVSSKLFLLHRDVLVEVGGDELLGEEYESLSSDTLTELTGMALSTELMYQNASLSKTSPYFPLTGPFNFRVNLLKQEPFSSYELSFRKESRVDSVSYKLHFDTPNSTIQRKVDAFISLDAGNANVVGSLQTPYVKVELSGKMDFNETSKSVGVVMRVDDRDLLMTSVGLTTLRNTRLSRYEPSFKLFVRDMVDLELKGRINFVEGSKYNAALELAGLTEEPLLFSADVTAEDNRYELIGSLDSPLLACTVHGNLRHTMAHASTKLTVEYSLRQAKSHTVSLAAKVLSATKGDVMKHSVHGSLHMTAAPQYNVLVGWDLTRSSELLENKAKFGLGQTEWLTKQLYRLHVRDSGDMDFAVLCSFACPVKSVDYQLDMQYRTTETSFKTYALAQLNAKHRFLASANLVHTSPHREITVEVSCPWHMISLEGELVEAESGMYSTRVVGRHVPSGRQPRELKLVSIYKNASTAEFRQHELRAEVSGGWSAQLSASVNASEGHCSQRVEVDVQGKMYKALVDYYGKTDFLHKIEAEVQLVDRTYRSSIELLHAEHDKMISIDLGLSKRLTMFARVLDLDDKELDMTFELFWDKDSDLSRRISLHASMSRERRAVRLEFPGQYIKGEINSGPTAVSGLLDWAPDQKITFSAGWKPIQDGFNATASLTTPFHGLKAQSLSAGYRNKDDDVKFTSNLAWLNESLDFFLYGGLLSSDRATFAGEFQLSSTLDSLSDIRAVVEHTARPGFVQHIHVVQYNRQPVVASSWRSKGSDLVGDFAFESPADSLHSIKATIKRGGGNLTLEAKYAESQLKVESIQENSGRSCLFNVITPYFGFENSTAKFSYGDLKFNADLEHNKTSLSLYLSGTKSDKFILGNGVLTTSFTKSLEVGITHSTDSNYLKEGVSISSDGEQLLLASVVGNTQLDDMKLTADLTMPAHSVIASVENRFMPGGLVSRWEGVWNNDRIATSLVTVYSEHELQAVASIAGSGLSKLMKVSVFHKRDPGSSYETSVDLSGVGGLKHELLIEDSFNWENMMEVRTPKRNAYLFNRQSLRGTPLKFVHNMDLKMNGPQVSAEMSYTKGNIFVDNANMKVVTPWTHPIELSFHLANNETTIQPKLKFQYSKTKEISVESVIQYQLTRSQLLLEINSPFCKPITVNALYDVSIPTKVALMTLRWEDKQMDLKSTVHFEREKAVGVLVATRSDVEGQIVNAQFKYDISDLKDMSGHVTLLYKGAQMQMDLFGVLLPGKQQMNCDISTPFHYWEKMSTAIDIDARKPTLTALVSVALNSDRLDLSGSSLITPSAGLVKLSLASTLPCVKSWQVYGSVDQTGVRATGEYAGQKAGLEVLLGQSVNQVTMRTPVSGFELLIAQTRYEAPSDTERSWTVVLQKNEEKLEVVGGWKTLKDSGIATILFQSPFEGLEMLEALLEHELYVDTMKTNIMLRRNKEVAQVSSSFVNKGAWRAKIEFTLPIEEYESLEVDLSISKTLDVATLILVKNKQRWQSTAEFKMSRLSLFHVTVDIKTPIQRYETIQSGLSFNWDTYEKAANIYLHIPSIRNEIKLVSNYAATSGTESIKVSVDLPLFSTVIINMEGDYNVYAPSLLLQGKLNGETAILQFEYLEQSLSASLLTSINGLKKITFESDYKVVPDKLLIRGLLQVGEDTGCSLRFESSISPLQSDILIEAETSIRHWEELAIGAAFDLTSQPKIMEVGLKMGEEEHKISVDWNVAKEMATGHVDLATTIENLKLLHLGAEYSLLEGKLSGRLMIQADSKKMEGVINMSDRAAEFRLDTPWEGFKSLSIAGSGQGLGGSNALIATLTRNQATSQLDLSVNTDKDTTTVTLHSPFAVCRTFVASLYLQGLSSSLSVIKNNLNLLEFSGKVDLESKSRIGVNVNLSCPLLPSYYETMKLSSLYNIEELKKSFEVKLIRNKITVLDFSSNIVNTETGGFTFLMAVGGDFPCFDKNQFLFEYKPEGTFIISSLIVSKADKEDTYSAQFGLTNTALQFGMKSPIKGYEHFTLILNKSDNAALVEFSTTILYYDLIKLASQINLKNYDDNYIIFSMQKDEEFVNADWKLQINSNLFAKTSVSLATSYESYKKYGLYLEYDLEGYNKGAIISLERNNQSLKLESIFIQHNSLASEASLNVTSSGSDDIKFYGSYDIGSTQLKKLSVMGLWGDDWLVDTRLVLESSAPKITKLSIMSLTPYHETTFSFAGSFDFSDPANTQTVTTSFSGLDVSLSVRAAVQDFWKFGKVSASMGTDVDAKAHGFSLVSWKLVNDREKKEAQLVLDFGEGKKTEATITVGLASLSNVNALFNFIDFAERSYEVTADWSSSKYVFNSQFGYKWNTDKSILLKSEFNYENYYPSSANIVLTSPFTSWKHVEFRNKWSFADSTIKFNSSLELSNHNKLALNIMFSKNQLFLYVAAPNMKPMKVEILRNATRSSAGAHDYSLDSAVSLGSWKNQFVFSYSLQLQGSNTVEVTLRTPIRGISFLHVNSKWNLATKEAKLLIEKEHQKWGISSALIKNDGKSHLNVIVSTPFEAYEDVRLESSCDVSDGITSEVTVLVNKQSAAVAVVKMTLRSMSLQVESPLKWFDAIQAEYVVDLEGPLYEASVNARMGLRYAMLQASVDTKTLKTILTEISLTSSWTKDISLSAVYRHEPNHSVRMILKRGAETEEISGTLKHISENMKREIQLESSINGQQSFVVKTGYNWQQPLKKLHLQVTAGDVVIHVRAEGKASREGITGDLHIDTPFEVVKLVEVKVQVEKTGYLSETGSYALRFNAANYLTRYTVDYAPNSINGHFSLHTPYFQIEDATVNIKHGKNLILVNVGVDGRTCDFEGSFQVDEPTSFLRAKLSAPFVKALELIEVSYELDTSEALFTMKTQWTPTEQIYLTLHFGVSDFLLKVLTPFEDLRVMEVFNKIQLDKESYKLLSKITWNDVNVDLDGSMTLNPWVMDVTFEATLGLAQVVAGHVALAASREKFSGHTTLTTQGRDVNIAGEIDMTDVSNLIAKLNINVPFFDIVPIKAVANLKQKPYKELQVQVDLPNASYKVGASFALLESSLKVGLSVDMPVIKYNILLGGSIYNRNNLDVDANAYVNDNKIAVSYKLIDKVFTSSLDFDAPFFSIADTRIDFQASTDFNPDIHGSITLKSGKLFGSVAASLLKTDGALSTRVDLDVPLLLGPLVRTVRFSVSYVGEHCFVEARYDNGRQTTSASLEVDKKTDWRVIGRASSPFIGQREVSFVLQKNWESLDVNLIDKLIVGIKNDANSGSVTVEYGGQEHKLVYEIVLQAKQLKGSLDIESPSLKSKKISLQVDYKNDGIDVEALVKCITGKNANTAFVHASNQKDMKTLVLEVNRDSDRVFRFEMDSVLDNANVRAGAALELLGAEHMAAVNYSREWPLDLHITVRSPYLPDQIVDVKLQVSSKSIAAHASLGDMHLQKYVSVVAKLDSLLSTALLDFQAPSLVVVDSVHLSATYQISEEQSLVSFEFLATSATATQAQFSVVLERNPASIFTSMVIVTPFDDYKLLQATIQIPLKLSNKFDLMLSANLPNDISFGLEAKFHSDFDNLAVRLAAHWREIELTADVKTKYEPVPTLELVLKTPLPMLRNYRLQLKRQRSLIDGDDFVNFVEWNDKRIELRHTMLNTPTEVVLRVQLTTPTSRYLAGVHFAFNQHKKALITLGYPGLAEDWIIEFDFRFKDLQDLSFLTQVRAPIFRNFEVASFMIGSKCDENRYRGVLTGRYNRHEMLVSAEGSLILAELKGEVKAQVNNQKLYLNLITNIVDSSAIIGMLEIETPFNIMRNANLSVMYSPFDYQMIHTNVVYNSAELFDLNLSRDEQNFKTLTVRNPWQHTSLKYLFAVHQDIQVWTEICWDLNNKQTSKFGGGLFMTGNREILLVVKLPTRDISFNASREYTSSLLDYSVHLSLDHNQTLGYRLTLDDSHSLIRLDFPFRSFEMSSHKYLVADAGVRGVKLLWDAAGDRSKQIAVAVKYTDSSKQLTLQHSALLHDVVITVEHSNMLPYIRHRARSVKLSLVYSPLEEEHLTLGYLSNSNPEQRQIQFNIRHLVSNLDHYATIMISQLADHTSGKISSYYRDSRTQRRSLELYGKLYHFRSEIELLARTTENLLALNGSLWTKDNGYRGVTVDLAMNQKQPLSLEARASVEEMSAAVEVGYGSGHRYALSAGVPTMRHMTVGVRHSLFGEESVDGELTMRLNTSRLLWTRIAWKLGVLDDMHRAVFREYSDIAIVAQNIVESFGDLMDEDVIERLQNVGNLFDKATANVGPYTRDEMNNIGKDFLHTGRMLGDVYERNDFYLQDIHRFIKNSIMYAQEKASCMVKQALEVVGATYSSLRSIVLVLVDAIAIDLTPLKTFASEIKPMVLTAWNHSAAAVKQLKRSTEIVRTTLRSLLTTTRSALARTDALLASMQSGLKSYSNQMTARFTLVAHSYVSSVQHFTVLMHDSLVAIERSFTELKEAVFTTVMSVKEVRELAEIYKKYLSWLEDFRVREYLDAAVQYLNIVGDILIEDFQRMITDYKEYIDAAFNLWSLHMKTVDEVPAVVSAKQVVNAVYHKVMWIWNYLAVSEELHQGVATVVNNLDNIVLELIKLIDADSNPSSSTFGSNMIVRPGLIELSQQLPVEWNNFYELPKYSQFTFPDYPDSVNVGKLKMLNTLLTSAISNPEILDSRFLPPFGATALVVGGQQFVTFDNRYYSFAGDCSYLLASDLVDSKFSVILNHHAEDGQPGRKSLTILSEGHVIHIGTNHRVTVDGIKTELPTQVGNAVSIVLEGNHLVVESENLVAVECNLHHDICAVKLSGWYFGKTGGLLGTFDNEPANDMQLPSGEMTTELERFTSSWRVGSNKPCSVTNIPLPNTTRVDSEQCDADFTTLDSPLAACFSFVEPQPFFEMCLSSGDRCTPILAYALQCARAGIEVEVPATCVRCQSPNGFDVLGGTSISVVGETGGSADVVFVVENADCLKDLNLGKLADKLELAMMQLGLDDNRFSVVSYGGDVPTHSRTSKGAIWSSARGIDKALQDLPLNIELSESSDQAVYDALSFASRLSFRAGASKTLVLVQCGACASSLDYAPMLEALNENAFTLHVLQPGAVQLRGAPTQGRAKVFGVDLAGAYTARNVKNIVPSKSLLKEVILPKDRCAPLAFETNGTVFNLDRATEGKKQLISVKKFIDVWSRRVAQSAQPAKCQTCNCVLDQDGVGQFQCSRCETPSIEHLLLSWQNLLTEDYGQIELQDATHSDELV